MAKPAQHMFSHSSPSIEGTVGESSSEKCCGFLKSIPRGCEQLAATLASQTASSDLSEVHHGQMKHMDGDLGSRDTRTPICTGNREKYYGEEPSKDVAGVGPPVVEPSELPVATEEEMLKGNTDEKPQMADEVSDRDGTTDSAEGCGTSFSGFPNDAGERQSPCSEEEHAEAAKKPGGPGHRRRNGRKTHWTSKSQRQKRPKRTDEEKEVDFETSGDPSGLKRRPDHHLIGTVENPHFITICQFLNLFPGALNVEWTFDDLILLAEAPELTEFGRSFLCKLFILVGRRFFGSSDAARFCSRFWEDREELDAPFLFPLKKNPFRDAVWAEVKPYQRLRLLRMLLNCALGESQVISKQLKEKSDVELKDGSLWSDERGNTYWFIVENGNLAHFKLYRECDEDGKFRLMAEDKETLEALSEAHETTSSTMELCQILGRKLQEIVNWEKRMSRELRRQKALSRQLEMSNWGATDGRRSRLGVDYTFKEHDKRLRSACLEKDEEMGRRISAPLDRSTRLAARNAKRIYSDLEAQPYSQPRGGMFAEEAENRIERVEETKSPLSRDHQVNVPIMLSNGTAHGSSAVGDTDKSYPFDVA